MLLPLLIATASSLPAPADTLLVNLLGEELDRPTYVAAAEPAPLPAPATVSDRLPYSINVSTPIPGSLSPGMPDHEVVYPTDAGFTWNELDRALATVESEVYRGAFPGAAVAVGRWGTPVLERGIGTHDWFLGSPPVHPDYTIYDLASLTKVVATTT